MLFRQWTDGTDFVLDNHDSPKRQFNLLAKARGWIGGEGPWNTKWQKCFDEEYVWRGDGATLDDKTDGSNFLSHTLWTHYDGFIPDPDADFLDEFERLANFMGWDTNERKEYRPKFLEAEFESYYGNNSKSLRNWRKLCRVCLIEPVPNSIEDCTTALKDILVNIVNVVDSRRTGEPIHRFATKRDFIDYTLPHRTYPLDAAKADTLMSCLLKPVKSEKYNALADKEYQEYMTGGVINENHRLGVF
ncbi:hypothetical protein DE146DRAFT_755265 [Phaeosphaeria sp. MPI-PUGE-AT-0046c]|nr:hypothetical protein DE146DRAFT_755265 [Phaeosphaeria sp. MPI-PUGE-AT-0046c]